MMRRLGLLGLLAIGVIGLWLFAGNRSDVPAPRATSMATPTSKPSSVASKPICSQIVVPAGTDCVPQHLAQLPPDPGPEGMKTLAGIDSDNDGVRDDVQRFIALNYGHSERAAVALRQIAKGVQQEILMADSVDPNKVKEIAIQLVMRPVSCFSRSVAKEIVYSGAVDKVVTEVANTPERFAKMGKFEVMAANRVYELSNDSTPSLCGYDPALLPN